MLLLNGYLTYIVGTLMVLLGGIDFVGLYDVPGIEGQQMVLEGLGFIGLKRAVTKVGGING